MVFPCVRMRMWQVDRSMDQWVWIRIVCLLSYVLATPKVISGWVPTSGSVHSWRLYSVSSLEHQGRVNQELWHPITTWEEKNYIPHSHLYAIYHIYMCLCVYIYIYIYGSLGVIIQYAVVYCQLYVAYIID